MTDVRTKLALELGNLLIANAEMASLIEARDVEIKKLQQELGERKPATEVVKVKPGLND
jgi:hypothetical protein